MAKQTHISDRPIMDSQNKTYGVKYYKISSYFELQSLSETIQIQIFIFSYDAD